MKAVLIRWGPLAVIAAALVAHSLQFGFITDDAFISFVYSRNLAEHGQLVFNLGDRVEGFTNFLWTVLLGLLMLVGLPPESTSLVLGAAFAIGTLVVAFRLMEHLAGGATAWDYLPPALLAASSGFACWTSGGLETQMFTFFVALSIYAWVRGDTDGRWLRRAGVFLALAAMTRPEGLLVAGVLGAHRLVWNLGRERRVRPSPDELRCLAWFLALFAPYYAWRWWYYGYPFPNTYYVKAAGEPPDRHYTAELHANGGWYVWQWARQSGLLYASPLALLGALAGRRKSAWIYFGSLALALTAVYLGYTVSVGGDFMGLHRFVMPLFFVGALLVALGLRRAVTLLAPQRTRRLAGALAAALLCGGFAWSQARLTAESLRWGNWAAYRGVVDTPAFLWVYTHDRAVLGRRLALCLRDDDFAIMGGAGAEAYYARMRGIDVFGLVSERIAHEVPPTRPRAGHNKWGPDALMLEHHPTLVLSCYSIHREADRPSLNCNPDFWLRNGFEQVTLRVDGLLQVGGGYYTFLARKDRGFDCAGRVR